MRSRSSGFTLVELLITVTIMVVLMALAVINLRSSQADARDAKRKGDIATIARGLENRYRDGFQAPSAGWLTSYPSPPSMIDYPSTIEIGYALDSLISTSFTPNDPVASFITEDLPGTSDSNFQPPVSGIFKPICVATTGCGAAGSNITVASIGKNYVYEPVDSSGQICATPAQDCVRFNLYYVNESGTAVVNTVRSKHQ